MLTACYVARTFGVRSATPMFEARRLCPHATVVRPDMDKYARAGREVRARMRDLTPLVEPVSIDEAFMDLSGTERLHGMSPAKALAGFAVLGGSEAARFLAGKPVSLIFGVGRVAQARLAEDGLRTIGDLQRAGERELTRRYGAEGARPLGLLAASTIGRSMPSAQARAFRRRRRSMTTSRTCGRLNFGSGVSPKRFRPG